jgi:hypothetical protein
MAEITYLGEDLTSDRPKGEPITWAGVTFEPGRAVEVTDERIIAKATANPYFDVDAVDMPTDTPRDRGVKAATDGKKRNVPPAYRGKSEAEDWLAGYDSVQQEA